MPQKKHISGNYKQKNKPFKGSSNKNKHKFRIQNNESGVTKKINKKESNRFDRRNKFDQLKQNKNERQNTDLEKSMCVNQIFEQDTKFKVMNTLKNMKPPRIVAFIPFNQNANAYNIKNGLEKVIKGIQSQNEELEEIQEQQDSNKVNYKFPYFQFFANPKTMSGLIKQNFIFMACGRDIQQALDLCKVADIICPILSCDGCNIEQTNLNPYENANAFDEFAYKMMSCLRIQGIPNQVCILQDLDKFAPSKQPKVKKLFSRFFAGEFNESMVTLENDQTVVQFLRQLQNVPVNLVDWKDSRGYLLADQVSYDKQSKLLEVTGFLKGNYLNAQQLVHITGYDDYQLEKIEILKNPYKLKLKSKKNKGILSRNTSINQTLNNTVILEDKQELEGDMDDEKTNENNESKFLNQDKDVLMTQVADEDLQEEMTKFLNKNQNHFTIQNGNVILNNIDEDDEDEQEIMKQKRGQDNEDEMKDDGQQEEEKKEENPNDYIEELVEKERKLKKQQAKEQRELEQQQKGEDAMEDDEEIDMDNGGNSDVSFDDIDDDQNVMDMMEEKQHIKKKFEFEMRAEDELMFEDEVEYDPNTQIRDRLDKYQSLKSFKTSEWNQYENLPDPYELIYTFKHFQKTRRLALAHASENAFAYSGFYVKLYIRDFPVEKLQSHGQDSPFIISGLLRHERKMTVINLKVKRNPDYKEGVIESKKDVEIHLGFKKFVTQPIYSLVYPGNTKTKYVKKIKDEQQYLATFYHPCTYGGRVLMFDNQDNKNQGQFALSGDIKSCDNLHVILKRIILTAYPHKIHKKRAVAKFMFFNPEDIRYFKPVELKTSQGMRGHIIEPLGTHGYMKCQFNTGIKQNDVLQLHLYKRVFPKNHNFQQELQEQQQQ